MNLPTDQLKEYGIINEDNSFSKKLSPQDINNFLNGHAIVADNGKDRLIFLLSDNNSRLNVTIQQRDQSLDDILHQSKNQIVYSQITELNAKKEADTQKKVFILDNQTQRVTEFDLLKDVEKVAKIVAEKENILESNRFKTELLKLKEFLQDKIDKFPEIAKEITNDLNIVSKTINTIDDFTPNESQSKKQEKTDIRLNVNDPDLYQDANREREIKAKQDLEQEQNQDVEVKRKTGFRR
ncbi:hypothetical protein CAPN002_00020 [Capnocytophaga stomatis]|uniref:hypothetical protein n=1 Tax=Capnocytophaga stomatis TaxID=1848904 RepID=UPI00194F04B6|nr:hypothetical protein [Capnocytophaga stomatis]GIJ92784.1 hypothetical protein CAPN002_00020 [Capnocytophaga stomatis]